eukprot:TRINITY_DN3164_c0_g1_i1.p1 TRINITY_DN3164_c0_g1~~TRINITY_DN3164_c0_g1_i1.p1  ORF type:complete len:1105 (+),score=212.45 TRINITY_DN3164_c0_g1_i1:413-3316(+)
MIKENEEIPCDVVILKCSDDSKNGNCFIQTSNLDGETNLKTRCAVPELMIKSVQDLCDLKGYLECELPNPHINQFDSKIALDQSSPLSLSEQNIALQATFLKNTQFIYGLVVYTGDDTKFGQNKRPPPTKSTKLDKLIDRMTIGIFASQLLVVVILGIIGNLNNKTFDPAWYLMMDIEQPWYWWIVIPLRFLLLLSLVIPISLKVSMDVIKYAYALFINWDVDMYDEETKTPANASSTAIAEDLAQVEYVFTDKTGTLTQNIMSLNQVKIGANIYSLADKDDVGKLQKLIRSDSSELEFFRHLSLCNSVMVSDYSSSLSNGEDDNNLPFVDEPNTDDIKHRRPNWKSSSPDEEALVEGCWKCGVTLSKRKEKSVTIEVFGKKEKFTIIHLLQFSSDRKRMSILVRNSEGKHVLLSKGADDVIFERSRGIKSDLNQYMQSVEQFSKTGLRTLVVAYRELTEEECKLWKVKLDNAKTQVLDREKSLNIVYDEIEQNLKIIGIAAIQDKLQDGVPETIQLLRDAGMKVWMLTGDKLSTAKQIAKSSNLVTSDKPDDLIEPLLPIEPTNLSSNDLKQNAEVDHDDDTAFTIRMLEKCISTHLNNVNRGKSDFSIIVEGRHLNIINSDEYLKSIFLELALQAKSVICCRFTPQQKSMVVKFVKQFGKITLSIGDGGNDVPMIQEASLGIGIAGREGLQAARAADYSFSQFRFLSRLLFVHGHYAYHRTAFVGHYCFHKSLYIALIQIFYAFYSGFSGVSFFNSFTLATYNIFYTGLPIMFYCLDRDQEVEKLLTYPQFYKDTQKGKYFNLKTLTYWVLRTVYQSTILFFFSIYTYSGDTVQYNGFPVDYISLPMLSFTAAVVIQTLTIVMESHSLTVLNWVIIIGTFVGYFAIISIANLFLQLDFLFVMFRLYMDPAFWLSVMLISAVSLVPFYSFRYITRFFVGDDSDSIVEREPLITYDETKSDMELDTK